MDTVVIPVDIVFSYGITLRHGSRGYEYVATHDIPAGATVLREKPFFRSKVHCTEMFSLDYIFDLDVANKLMDLVPRGHGKITLTESKLSSYTKILIEKYLMNRFDSHQTGEAQALYYGSFFNHSCVRNVDPIHDLDDTSFIAIRDIKAGEELTISYTCPDQSFANRQHTLKLHYNFDCRCEKCIKEADDQED